MNTTPDIRFNCPCGQKLSAESAWAGQQTTCPACDGVITVPDATPQEPIAPQTKACPMCSETILATAKKCKHCGEYLEGVTLQLSRQTFFDESTKDEAIALLCAVLLWPFGCLYASPGVFGFALAVGLLSLWALATGGFIGFAFCFFPSYVGTIIASVIEVRKYNERLRVARRKKGLEERRRAQEAKVKNEDWYVA